jgi:flagella basal body P-ring formation protein FlgA
MRRFLLLTAQCFLAVSAFAETASPVAAAVEAASREAFGVSSEVDVTLGMVAPAAPGPVTATVAPGGRVGQPSRFLLWRSGRQVGYAVATVEVTADYMKPVRAIARDEIVDGSAVAPERGRLPKVPFLRLPGREEVIGASARRALAAGEPILNGLVVEIPAVRSGDTVQARLTRGAVQIVARAVASGTGRVGDVIRVRTGGAARVVLGRITAPGEVEVLP